MVEFFVSGGEKPAEKTIDLIGMLAEAFNPLGSAGLSLQTITPSVIDPLAALAENKDFAGRQIATPDFNTLDPTPGFERNRAGVSPVGDAIARAIDTFTGGSGYTPGSISPTGDQIDYLLGQLTGGAGKTVLNTASVAKSAVTGEEVPNYKIPIVGRMIGDKNEAAAVSSRFYENVKLMNGHEREIEGREEDGKDVEPYFAKHPEADLYEDAKSYQKDVRELRKERDALIEEGASREEIKMVNEDLQMVMVEFNQLVAEYKRMR
jgi:hypothetical protein